MSKKGAASRWNGRRARFTEEMIEDDRNVRKRGRFVRVSDEVSENSWIERRRSPKGFYRGAKVSR